MKSIAIQEIKDIIANITDENDPIFVELAEDSRKGVQSLLKKWQREHQIREEKKQRFIHMSQYEIAARKEGFEWIAGIDEVGRGPLAGPVVSAAVILRPDQYIEGLDDSKKMSGKNRNKLYEQIKEEAVAIGIGVIYSDEIDQINIFEATKKSMLQAIKQLSQEPDLLLIDALHLNTPYTEQSIVKGDANSISIAAASIIAKVTRDRMMAEYDKQYPGYGFAQHMGYGTKAHLAAIDAFGACPIHRKSFEPIKSMK
ncbi:ribonuclease HII [Bacillus sp. FJAT-50079]|uniref:ribonuclease HII n=1 Tax=Bacillus sp. FJAT-50079 TaxID=2833577 RepID=UPI001BCA0E4C|nr:ribonuclease HII [Bacillus sp. FJAT-50079]MBS4207642.1 ribonuclease HII [Bacillus sp. FJAT-50079]